MKKKSLTQQPVISAQMFDKLFDEGKDISAYIEWDSPFFDSPLMPKSIVEELDIHARRLGTDRNALQNLLLSMWLDQNRDKIKKP